MAAVYFETSTVLAWSRSRMMVSFEEGDTVA